MGKKAPKPFVTQDLIQGALHALLLMINAMEGCEALYDSGLDATARDLLFDFKNHLGTLDDYAYNDSPKLVALDKVFKEAGWDDQGIRWTKENDTPLEGEDVFIVEFTNPEHTEWKIA